ncbi:MAG: hypothetical protein IT426_07140 [Pirellulales bacterium]|nr:hypothetical protein [Pirellulales bacterium]
MITLESAIRWGKMFVFALAVYLLSICTLFAQEGAAAKGGGGGSWIFSYFLTGLSIVLGLLVICRASTRRDRVRPEAYSEGKGGKGKDE